VAYSVPRFHGVTTVIASTAALPCRPPMRRTTRLLVALLSAVEGIPVETLMTPAANWKSYGEFFSVIEGKTAPRADFWPATRPFAALVMGENCITGDHGTDREMCGIRRRTVRAGRPLLLRPPTRNPYLNHPATRCPPRVSADLRTGAARQRAAQYPEHNFSQAGSWPNFPQTRANRRGWGGNVRVRLRKTSHWTRLLVGNRHQR